MLCALRYDKLFNIGLVGSLPGMGAHKPTATRQVSSMGYPSSQFVPFGGIPIITNYILKRIQFSQFVHVAVLGLIKVWKHDLSYSE